MNEWMNNASDSSRKDQCVLFQSGEAHQICFSKVKIVSAITAYWNRFLVVGRHAANAVYMSKSIVYSGNERPSITQHLNSLLGILLSDEKLAAAVIAVATAKQRDEKNLPEGYINV